MVRAVLGATLLLLGPGLAWSFLLLPGRRLGWLERLGVSAGLSVALMVASSFLLSKLFHVKEGFKGRAPVALLLDLPLDGAHLLKAGKKGIL